MHAKYAASLFILSLAVIPLAIIAVCCCTESGYAWLQRQFARIDQWANSRKSTAFITKMFIAALGILRHLL